MEYYLELYSTQNVVTEAALGIISLLPTLVVLDEDPSTQELSRAIDFLSSGKVPGQDGIPPEVINFGKDALIPDLHDLLIQV